MRIACPSCGAAYDVPEARLAPGRPVRCARCSHRWTPIAVPPPPEPAIAPAPVPPPQPPPALVEPALPAAVSEPARPAPPIPSGGRALTLAWALSLVALVAGLTLAVVGRTAIVHAWPPSERLYAALGLVNAHR